MVYHSSGPCRGTGVLRARLVLREQVCTRRWCSSILCELLSLLAETVPKRCIGCLELERVNGIVLMRCYLPPASTCAPTPPRISLSTRRQSCAAARPIRRSLNATKPHYSASSHARLCSFYIPGYQAARLVCRTLRRPAAVIAKKEMPKACQPSTCLPQSARKEPNNLSRKPTVVAITVLSVYHSHRDSWENVSLESSSLAGLYSLLQVWRQGIIWQPRSRAKIDECLTKVPLVDIGIRNVAQAHVGFGRL